MRIVSWISNFLTGAFGTCLLMIGCWAALSVLMSLLGVLRRRCEWYWPLTYFFGTVVLALMIRGMLWLDNLVNVDEEVSTILFWTGVLFGFFSSIGLVKTSIRKTWTTTNGPRRLPATDLSH
jgi:hypothetical protein